MTVVRVYTVVSKNPLFKLEALYLFRKKNDSNKNKIQKQYQPSTQQVSSEKEEERLT